jgi:hypothetical protein
VVEDALDLLAQAPMLLLPLHHSGCGERLLSGGEGLSDEPLLALGRHGGKHRLFYD